MFILASNSQTRAQLLKKFGIDFIQKPSFFDEEKIITKVPREFIYKATYGKMESFLKENTPSLPVLCADTVVTCKDTILRKAKDKEDARKILNLQSGNEVSIITCMIYKCAQMTLIDISQTLYEFDEFSQKELELYLQSDEWKGKAGACMVEGFCKPYIRSVKGYESTAMGLCVEKLLPFLEEGK